MAADGTLLHTTATAHSVVRTVTFMRGLGGDGVGTLAKPERVRLRVSSGKMHAVIGTDGEVSCTAHYPSILGDIALPEGCWAYEIAVLATDAGDPRVAAVIGWVDSKLFFGDYVQEQGVGDTPQSWGVVVQDTRAASSGAKPGPRKRTAGTDSEFGLPIHEGCTVTCAVKVAAGGVVTMSFGLDGKWQTPMGEAFAGAAAPSGHVTPAVSLRAPTRLQFNFGERPFTNPVPEGYIPIHNYAVNGARPAGLQHMAPPPSTQRSDAIGLCKGAQVRELILLLGVS